MTATPNETTRGALSWRTPLIIVLFGCVISMVSFGPRSSLGQFLTPISLQNGWTRETFSIALALQNLFWGLGQPLAGAVADRFGTVRVLIGGLMLYGAGLALMAFADTPGLLHLSAGGLIGFGLAGASGNMVIGAFGKLVPESRRAMAFGASTAAGSFGQFLFSPLARGLIDGFGWQSALLIFAAVMVLSIPFCFALATPTNAQSTAAQPQQSFRAALSEAFAHPSYVMLVLGFFTCGFQLAFTTVHLPAYLVDRGLGNEAGAWTIAVIGLFNIFGSLTAGYLSGVMPKRYILAIIYFSRAASIAAFILLPATFTSALVFGAVSGFLWLSTVPPTSALVAVMFGTRWLTMLFGFAFFSHQVGGFLGVWLGGWLFVQTGSYDIVWWLSIALGIASGLINLPIREKAVARQTAAAT